MDAYTNADQLSQVGQLNGVPLAAGNAGNPPGFSNVRNNLHLLNSPLNSPFLNDVNNNEIFYLLKSKLEVLHIKLDHNYINYDSCKCAI